jgi:hypothetical protein
MKCFYPFRKLTSLAAAFALLPVLAQAQSFTPGNIVVARVGDGSAALTSAATEVFLDEFSPDGTLVRSIGMPTPISVSGNNHILTASGNVPTELNMTRSVDGHYLVLTGYSAAPGTRAVASSTSTDVTRVIGLIAADGSIDTSTSTGDGFNTVSIRAAATVDGTSFYSVGDNSGVLYQTFGSFMTTQLNTAPASMRSINIVDGNLYASTDSNPYIGLNQVGTGLPDAVGQTVAVLPGFPATISGASPGGFYFADLSANVPGVDVVYVADDRSTGGGIQKWSLVNNTWTLNGTIASSATAVVRGLNGATTGATVSLVATSNTRLYVLADNAGYNAAPSIAALPTAIAMAGTNTAFRGLAFAPVAPVPTIVSFTPSAAPAGTTVTVTGTNLLNASVVTLNGVAIADFVVVDATTLTFDVPPGATSGLIDITTPGGTVSSTSAFTVTAPNPIPTITSLTPPTAVVGSGQITLTITGTGFISGSEVHFNGTALATTQVSSTQLTAVVPTSALVTVGSYAVTVANPAPGGGVSTDATFTVTAPAPTISSFTPGTGGPGTTVTITGTNFTGTTAVSIGKLVISSFTVVSATSITMVLPTITGSISGLVTVVTPGGTATSTTSFSTLLATLASQAMPGLTVFPNPATDYLTVELPQVGAATATLRDLTGRVILTPTPLIAHQPLRLPATLAAGIYFLEVQQGSVKAVRRVEKQ